MQKYQLIRVVFVIVVATAILAGCAKAPETESAAPLRHVEVIDVHTGSYAEQITVSGRIETSREALLSFRAGGIIAEINVDDGDRFRAGQLLAALDTTEIAAGLVDATQQREKAERDVARLQRLYEQDAISLQQFQDAETGLERARAGERRTRFIFDNARIHAPFDGFVAIRLANEGEMIGEGSPVLRVVEDGSRRVVRVAVPSRIVPWLHVEDEASLTVETIDETLTATIQRIGAVAEPTTGNFVIELSLPAHELLREGLVAKVTLAGPLKDGIALPAGALAEGDVDRGVVYVVEDGVALKRQLMIQRISGDLVYVAPDLADGSSVVISGAGFLSDGEAVEVVHAAESDR